MNPSSTPHKPSADNPAQSVRNPDHSVVIPRVAETARVDSVTRETGKVIVHVTPRERTEVIDLPVQEQTAHIERVSINQFVDQVRPPRQEGDVTIVPIYEEVVVVERRLVLKEEVRITRTAKEHHERQEVKLREEQVSILRTDAPTAPPNSAPPNK